MPTYATLHVSTDDWIASHWWTGQGLMPPLCGQFCFLTLLAMAVASSGFKLLTSWWSGKCSSLAPLELLYWRISGDWIAHYDATFMLVSLVDWGWSANWIISGHGPGEADKLYTAGLQLVVKCLSYKYKVCMPVKRTDKTSESSSTDLSLFLFFR